MEEDWYKPPTERFSFYNFGIKRCTEYEFGDDIYGEYFLSTWYTQAYKFDLFCPDLKQQDLRLYNQKGAMKSKSIGFRVERCVEDDSVPIDSHDHTSKQCKSDSEIDEVLKELVV